MNFSSTGVTFDRLYMYLETVSHILKSVSHSGTGYEIKTQQPYISDTNVISLIFQHKAIH